MERGCVALGRPEVETALSRIGVAASGLEGDRVLAERVRA